MSITKSQCGAMLADFNEIASQPRKMMASSPIVEEEKVCALQTCFNSLIHDLSVPFFDVLRFSVKIVNILGGEGTWKERFDAVYALFGKTTPAGVTIPKGE